MALPCPEGEGLLIATGSARLRETKVGTVSI